MLNRVQHSKFGVGVVLEERRTESGKPVSVVVFDARPDEERILLSEFLQPSDAPLPEAAKAIKRKRTPKPKPEKLSDALLVEAHDQYLPDSEGFLESAVEE